MTKACGVQTIRDQVTQESTYVAISLAWAFPLGLIAGDHLGFASFQLTILACILKPLATFCPA